jgi:hypothetical protein
MGLFGHGAAHGEKMAITEVTGDSGETPAGDKDICRGKCDDKFVGWIVGARLKPVGEELAGVETVGLSSADDKLDARTVSLAEIIAVVVGE